MPVRLSDAAIRGLKPGAEIRDSLAPGLVVRVQRRDPVFTYVYKREGRVTRVTLGKYPGMTEATFEEAGWRRLNPLVFSRIEHDGPLDPAHLTFVGPTCRSLFGLGGWKVLASNGGTFRKLQLVSNGGKPVLGPAAFTNTRTG